MKIKFALAPMSLVSVLALSACAGIGGSDSSKFLSIQDGRAVLVDGVGKVGKAPDSLAVIELRDEKLRLHSELVMPTSLVGPPASIAVLPDKKYALVTAATKLDPSDANKVISSDLISLVALGNGREPLKVVDSISLGAGPSGLAVNRAGDLALVPNRVAGTVSIVEIKGQKDLLRNAIIYYAEKLYTEGNSAEAKVWLDLGKEWFMDDKEYQVTYSQYAN